MWRALILLNLYGHQDVWHKLKKGLKHKKCIFSSKLSLCLTAWQPYRLSKINALHINWSYSPKDQSLKFLPKNIENWSQFFWVGHFGIFASFLFKSVTNSWGNLDGTQLLWLPWFPEKPGGAIELWNTL